MAWLTARSTAYAARFPPPRSLPLLAHLARRSTGRVLLEYLAGKRLAVEVSACR